MLIQAYFLTEEQLNELDRLCDACRKVDGNHVAVYRHMLNLPRPIPCNILYYDKQRLVGFLRPFFFELSSCEIALMVDPEYRRRGIAREMFQTVQQYLFTDDIHKLTFSVPHDRNEDWLLSQGLTFQGSEYRMQYQISTQSEKKFTADDIRLATLEDIPTLCAIDLACFSKKRPDLELHFTDLIEGDECEIYLINQNDTPVGKAHLFWYTDRVRLTDIAVLPQAQSRGFATRLIKHCIDLVLATGVTNITLDVETKNKNALNLYKKLGFAVTNAHDYWRALGN